MPKKNIAEANRDDTLQMLEAVNIIVKLLQPYDRQTQLSILCAVAILLDIQVNF